MSQKIPMGIGVLGSADIVFKRKFRFTFEIKEVCGGNDVPPDFVKIAARPSLSIEETQIDFLNGRTWIPGKGFWETITVTYNDVAVTDMQPLYNWLNSIYEFGGDQAHVSLRQGSRRSDNVATGIVKLWDGCGTLIETWTLRNMFPTGVNWNDLNYGDTEIATIDLTLRYSDVSFVSNCPAFTPETCCTPCNGISGPLLPDFV